MAAKKPLCNYSGKIKEIQSGDTLSGVTGTGDVVGPASATDNALVRFDDVTGKLVQNSNAILTDAGDLALAGNTLSIEKSDAVAQVSAWASNLHSGGSAYIGALADTATIIMDVYGSTHANANIVGIVATANSDFQIKSDSDIHFYPTGVLTPSVTILETDLFISRSSPLAAIALYAENTHPDNRAHVQAFADTAVLTLTSHGSNDTGNEDIIELLAQGNTDLKIKSDSAIHFYPSGAITAITTLTGSSLMVEKSESAGYVSVDARNTHTDGSASVAAAADTATLYLIATGSTNIDPNHLEIYAANNDSFAIYSNSDITFYPTGTSTAIFTLYGDTAVLQKDFAGVTASYTYNKNTSGVALMGVEADVAKFYIETDGSTIGGGLANAIIFTGQSNDDFQIWSASDIHFYPTGASTPILTLTSSDLAILKNWTGVTAIFAQNTTTDGSTSIGSESDNASVYLETYGSTYGGGSNDVAQIYSAGASDFRIRSNADIHFYPSGSVTPIIYITDGNLSVQKSDAGSPVSVVTANTNTGGVAALQASADTAIITSEAYGSTNANPNLVTLIAAGNDDFQITSDSDIHIYPSGESSPVITFASYALLISKSEAGAPVSISTTNTHSIGWAYIESAADTAYIDMYAYGSTHATKANRVELVAGGENRFDIIPSSGIINIANATAGTSGAYIYTIDSNDTGEIGCFSSAAWWDVTAYGPDSGTPDVVLMQAGGDGLDRFELISYASDVWISSATGKVIINTDTANPAVTFKADGTLQFHSYTAGYLQTDGSGNVTAGSISIAYTIVPLVNTDTPHTVVPTTGETIYLVNTSSGGVALNLPTAVGNTAKYVIKKTDSSANVVEVYPSGVQTIDGADIMVITGQYDAMVIVSNNANWFII